MRRMLRYVLAIGLVGASGCSVGTRDGASRGAAAGAGDGPTSFARWCADWQLTCPDGPPTPVPTVDHPWTVEQWRSFASVLRAVLASPGHIRLTRAELDDASLRQIAAALHLGPQLDQLRARL